MKWTIRICCCSVNWLFYIFLDMASPDSLMSGRWQFGLTFSFDFHHFLEMTITDAVVILIFVLKFVYNYLYFVNIFNLG